MQIDSGSTFASATGPSEGHNSDIANLFATAGDVERILWSEDGTQAYVVYCHEDAAAQAYRMYSRTALTANQKTIRKFNKFPNFEA